MFGSDPNRASMKTARVNIDGLDAVHTWPRYGGSRRVSPCAPPSISKHVFHVAQIWRFIQTLDLGIWLSTALAIAATYMCIQLEFYWNVQVAILVSPLVFPLAFSINESYRRREKVLDDMSAFFGSAAELFWHHRDWQKDCVNLPDDHTKKVLLTTNELVLNVIHYVATGLDNYHRAQRLGAVYRCFSTLSKQNDMIRCSKLPANSPLVTRLSHYHNVMLTSFERIRAVREYRTPRNIRSYTKVIVFSLPILLAPYFAYMARKGSMDLHGYWKRNPAETNEHRELESFGGQEWSAYYSVIICSIVFGSLQSVQDSLDDPFDGIGEDDVDLQMLTAWSPIALWEKPEDQVIPVLETRLHLSPLKPFSTLRHHEPATCDRSENTIFTEEYETQLLNYMDPNTENTDLPQPQPQAELSSVVISDI
eukprot:m.149879 g.149879  ORF g.149879 m.149879 type:complete len:422 (-) comp30688_c0_seq2:308-1573(-)